MCTALALSAFAAQPAAAAGVSLPPSTTCSGTIHTNLTTSGVSVAGSAACANLTTLNLTTTVNAAGALSSVTGLLPALPNVPVPINTSIPAAGVTSACSVLVDTSTGAKVTTSCTAT
ncbi:MAG: hypothetical protein AUI14_08960 [Actinobacteria bacterium 13_2_20CM_2_71_6]|nr:MAG: hypothetical protein AUI14_08960 [Actinobacteria bacterium 13_2_20CM_2_71_6]